MTNLFLPYHPSDSVESKFRMNTGIEQDDIIWDKIIELVKQGKTEKEIKAIAFHKKKGGEDERD